MQRWRKRHRCNIFETNRKGTSRFVLKNADLLLRFFYNCDKLFNRPWYINGTYFYSNEINSSEQKRVRVCGNKPRKAAPMVFASRNAKA